MKFDRYIPQSLGIYVHIPFCRSKCAYCDFNSARPESQDQIKKYIDALITHMKQYKKSVDGSEVDTVFIGGGTPTSIPSGELCRLIRAIRSTFPVRDDAEFSIEANPATVTLPLLKKIRKMGVNRISFGLQSSDDDELKLLSRIHTKKEFLQSFRLAREAGFENINVDLMFGIPYQTQDSLDESIQWTASLRPEHISLYNLIIEPNTAFGQNYDQIGPMLPDDETQVKMYLNSVELLALLGYQQYEISNFSLPGRRCRHNIRYWNCDSYLGFGVSAHSYFNGNRFSWTRDIGRYIEGVMTKESQVKITEEWEEIGERDMMGEYVMLRLRLTDGINETDFARRFGYSFEQLFGEKCRRYLESRFMVRKNRTYSLTPKGMFVSNYILSDLLDFDGFSHFSFPC